MMDSKATTLRGVTPTLSGLVLVLELSKDGGWSDLAHVTSACNYSGCGRGWVWGLYTL